MSSGNASDSTKTTMRKTLIQATEEIFAEIARRPSLSLTKQEVKEILGDELDSFYTNVVQALVDTGQFIRVRGYYGGVQLNPLLGQGDIPDWLTVSSGIEQSFRDIAFETPIEATKSEDIEKEEQKRTRAL